MNVYFFLIFKFHIDNSNFGGVVQRVVIVGVCLESSLAGVCLEGSHLDCLLESSYIKCFSSGHCMGRDPDT